MAGAKARSGAQCRPSLLGMLWTAQCRAVSGSGSLTVTTEFLAVSIGFCHANAAFPCAVSRSAAQCRACACRRCMDVISIGIRLCSSIDM